MLQDPITVRGTQTPSTFAQVWPATLTDFQAFSVDLKKEVRGLVGETEVGGGEE